MPLGVALCFALEVLVAGGIALFERSEQADFPGIFGLALLIAMFAFPMAFVGGFLLGLPVASWLERHIMRLWVPAFLALWGGFGGYAISFLFLSVIFGWRMDMGTQMAAVAFGSPFGLSVGLCWWYLRRRLEREGIYGAD